MVLSEAGALTGSMIAGVRTVTTHYLEEIRATFNKYRWKTVWFVNLVESC